MVCNLAIDAYYGCMADFSHILMTRPDFGDDDREWLHQLVADWQVIADLSFADLLLILQNGEGKYIIAEQCRPSTVMSLRAEDVVGNVVPESLCAELDAAMDSESVFRSSKLRTVGKAKVCNVYAPVRHNGKTLGLVVRETNMATRESNGRYESESISAGKQLYEMIPRGQFPYRNPVMNQRHNARVADGFIVLTVDGIVRYASPNAISCFRRLGSVSTMQGEYLSEIGTKLLHENDPVLETLPLVLSGKAAVDSELDANKAAVSMRSLPLMDANGRVGGIVLCRDVSELRRREKELQTKDATISEIHHRVKNNLQAVSALLRLQARKTKSEEVKKELKEAQRRVQTIAMVHEGLSQTADEIVDYDKVISNLLKMAVDLATMRDQHIDVDFVGKFGMMPAQDATPLSLVLTELITNSVEHGFEGRKEDNMAEEKTILLTQEAYDKMKEELAWREGEYRDEILSKVSAARAEGDLSENGGYQAAREAQRVNQGRIDELTVKLRNAKILTAPKAGEVGDGSLVTLEVNGREMVYVLGTRDLSIATDYSIISPESPIGAAINGAHAGDTVTYTAPNGREISVTIKEAKPLA